MERLWKSDLENGTFQNPILFADYSDPDVIRVGETYYLTASSFNYIPGLPILTSKDLVNWKLVNYALSKIDYETYDVPQHSKGVWAPSIRYREGFFYIYYGMPDEGIFMVRSRDPLGQWEPPVLVLEGKGLIDPCPFWEEDGTAYVIHGYAKSRIGFKSYLGIFSLSSDGKRAIGDDKILFNGVEAQPTIEGPKVYKRNEYYYIFAPAGGVRTGWQTVLRSQNIMGPYEEKVVMRQGNTGINGPHQGGLTDTISGDEWFLHFQDRGLYGRIVHMQPVCWENDWPIIGVNETKEGVGEPCLIHEKPKTGTEQELCYLEASDEFDQKELSLQWQWLGNSKENFYSLTANPGKLRLYCLNPAQQETPIIWHNANVLTQKLICPYFEAVTCLSTEYLSENEQAGMTILGGEYAYLAVRISRGKKVLVFAQSIDTENGRKEKVDVNTELPADNKEIYLKFRMEEGTNGPVFLIDYSLNGMEYTNIKIDFMPSDHTWVGAKIGLFANVLEKEEKGGYADFEYIRFRGNQKNIE